MTRSSHKTFQTEYYKEVSPYNIRVVVQVAREGDVALVVEFDVLLVIINKTKQIKKYPLLFANACSHFCRTWLISLSGPSNGGAQFTATILLC